MSDLIQEDMEEGSINQNYTGDNENDDPGISFTEYEISASPNDFNVKTLYDFIDSGIVKIPGFQRNYVWDIKRASKLIESLLIWIPIPQIFLYEQGKNNFLVIDWQQRFFTIYFFIKKRFPKKEKRLELRNIFENHKWIPENILSDNAYFVDFNLSLPEQLPEKKNKFNKLNYSTLVDDDKTGFNYRTIRNIIIKQTLPNDGDSVIFEIFNRLNSGWVNLKPQEIRTSLYHSEFYQMLYEINLDINWRNVLPNLTPDLNMKDVEILLRWFAMLTNHLNYKPSLSKYLNDFSYKAKKYSTEQIDYLKQIFLIFISKIAQIDQKIFFTKQGRFNISMYESIFVAITEDAYLRKDLNIKDINLVQIGILKEDSWFIDASAKDTASTNNVKFRIKKAKELL